MEKDQAHRYATLMGDQANNENTPERRGGSSRLAVLGGLAGGVALVLSVISLVLGEHACWAGSDSPSCGVLPITVLGLGGLGVLLGIGSLVLEGSKGLPGFLAGGLALFLETVSPIVILVIVLLEPLGELVLEGIFGLAAYSLRTGGLRVPMPSEYDRIRRIGRATVGWLRRRRHHLARLSLTAGLLAVAVGGVRILFRDLPAFPLMLTAMGCGIVAVLAAAPVMLYDRDTDRGVKLMILAGMGGAMGHFVFLGEAFVLGFTLAIVIGLLAGRAEPSEGPHQE